MTEMIDDLCMREVNNQNCVERESRTKWQDYWELKTWCETFIKYTHTCVRCEISYGENDFYINEVYTTDHGHGMAENFRRTAENFRKY